MKRIMMALLAVAMMATITGCGESTKTRVGASRGNYVVIQYSGGVVINRYEVKDGLVNTESGSDGYFFKDQNGMLVRVSGTVNIQQVK